MTDPVVDNAIKLLKDLVFQSWKSAVSKSFKNGSLQLLENDIHKTLTDSDLRTTVAQLLIEEITNKFNIVEEYKNYKNCVNCSNNCSIHCIYCNVEEIIETLKKFCEAFTLNNNTCHDYFIYCLYGILKDSKCNDKEIHEFYIKLNSHWKCDVADKSCNIKYLPIKNKDILKNKKELYDFLRYYRTIKILLNKQKSSEKTTFCNYINYFFSLYEKIHKEYNLLYSGTYDKEIELFKSIFKHAKDELEFLDINCPHNKANLAFDKENRKIKQIKQNLYEDFVKEKSQEFENIKNDLLENSSMYGFYSKLDGNYNVGASMSYELKEGDDDYIKDNENFLNVWKKIDKILLEWSSYSYRQDNLSNNERCEYINYWLYDQIKDNSDPRNIIPFLYRINGIITSKGYCKRKNFDFHVEQINNKKHLHDFVRSYDFIKDKLKKANDVEREMYCKYINIFFDLYKHMEQEKKGVQGYKDEIVHFQNKLYNNINELIFLNSYCPGKCLGYIFTDNYKKFCASSGDNTKGKKSENGESYDTKNNFTAHYSKKKNDLISKYIIEDTTYIELDMEKNSEYLKHYCTDLNEFEYKHKGAFKLCHKLVKNLIDLYRIEKNVERNDRCYALKHWLCEEIRKLLSVNSNDVSKEPVIDKLRKVVFTVNHNYLLGNPCYIDLVGTLDQWKEEKELYDYFNVYDKIEKHTKSNKNSCDKYINSLSSINELYEKHLGRCCYCYSYGKCVEICPGYFKCDEKFNPYNIFSKLNCEGENIKNFKHVKKPPPVDHFVKTRTLNSFLFASNRTKFDTFYTITTLLLGLLGIFMIHFIFYKFTPYGSFINKKVFNNKNNMINMSGKGKKKLEQNILKHRNTSKKSKTIHFSYQNA